MTHEEETLAAIVDQGGVQVLTGLLTNDVTSGDAQVKQRPSALCAHLLLSQPHMLDTARVPPTHPRTPQLVAAVLFFMYSVCLVPQYKSQVLSAGALSAILASYSRHVNEEEVVSTFRDIVEVRCALTWKRQLSPGSRPLLLCCTGAR